jgi:RND superfamily putative drug exporter
MPMASCAAVRRLASACIRHPRITFLAWVGALIVCIAAASASGENFSENFDLPESDSQQALELIEEAFPQGGGDEVQIVLLADEGSLEDPENSEAVERVLGAAAEVDGIVGVSSPLEADGALSEDGRIGLANAQLDTRSYEVDAETIDDLLEIRSEAEAQDAPISVELGGEAVRAESAEEGGGAELIGLLAAIIVLLIMFGSVVAMGLPILTAVLALGAALSLVTVLTNVMDVADFAPQLAAMIGLGVGIDYALFIVTRYRSGLAAGMEPDDAVLLAMDTAGRAVLFAGATVCVAMLGLFAVGVNFLYGPAIAASLAVLVTMFASLTLLPALLSKAGRRIDRIRIPGIKAGTGEEGAFWSRWSASIQARPWPAAMVAVLILVVLAIPVFSIELGNADAGTDRPETTTRKAYDLLAEGFGPGFNGPLIVVSDLSSTGAGGSPREGLRQLGELRSEVDGVEGVAATTPPITSDDGQIALIRAFPTTGPQETETRELVERIREDALVPYDEAAGGETHLGGETAITVDFDAYVAGKLPLFMGVVIVLSALLLLVAFRSVLVALKAIVMNVLSIAASFGLVVAIFQWGWGNELIGISETAPIISFLPVMAFAIVFGLSMDYEVFLMSRVHEEWERRGDASAAVQHGLASTGRVITAAATIMICVFGSFALGGDLIIKMFGIGLAAAIAIDAFLIRSLLVPAVMELLGSRAWWIPGWLDRILSHVHIESEEGEVAPAPAPSPK